MNPQTEEQTESLKGYMDITNITLCSQKLLKHFEYEEEECLRDLKSIDLDFNEEEFNTITIDSFNFYNTMEYFNKENEESISFNFSNEDKNSFIIKSKNILFESSFKYPILENKNNKLEYPNKTKYNPKLIFNFLKNFNKKDFKFEEIEISFKTDFPVKIKFKGIWFILSPRIEED